MQEHRFSAAINDSIKNCIINYNNSQTQKSEKRLNKPFLGLFFSFVYKHMKKHSCRRS